jgi:hypothetical protein
MQKLRDFDASKETAWIREGFDSERIQGLLDQVRQAGSAMVSWYENVRLSEEAFRCLWENKTLEGRKGELDADGEPSKPWRNASDAEVRKVMQLVLEHRDVCLTAGVMAQWDGVSGVGPEDHETAKKVRSVLRYFHSRAMPEAGAMENLWTLWGALYGVSILNVDWRKAVRLVPEEWSGEDILAALVPEAGELAQTLGMSVGALLSTPLPPEALAHMDTVAVEEVLIELRAVAQTLNEKSRLTDGARLLREAFPEVTPEGAKKALRVLQKEGRCRLPVKKLAEDRPEWRALIPGDHVFFPPETPTGFLQDAPWIAKRMFLTEEELRLRLSDPQGDLAWDKEWVEAVVEKTANLRLADFLTVWRRDLDVTGKAGSILPSPGQGDVDRFEVLEIHYRARDEYGCHGLYRAVVSAHLRPSDLERDEVPCCGWHGLAAHGWEYPYIPYIYEETHDLLLGNRGIGLIARDKQSQLKSLHDQQVDATDLKLRPPLMVPLRDARLDHQMRPGGRVVYSTQGSAQFMPVGQGGQGEAVQLTSLISGEASRLTGSEHEAVAPQLTIRRQGLLATRWLQARARALMLTLEMAKTHVDRVTVLRVSGDMAGPFAMDREELRQSEFDLQFLWDPRSLDGEVATKLLATIREVLGLDQAGLIDRSKLLMDVVSFASPFAVDRWLTDQTRTTQAEVDEEKKELAQVLQGIEATYAADKGQNAQLRLQVMTQLEQSAAVSETLQIRPAVAELWEMRKKHFQFVLDQRENAAIGRSIGVKPIHLLGQV